MTTCFSDSGLNKDVANIIGQYTRPNLWLYWVKNDKVFDDPFQMSTVISANNIEDALEHIFNKHIYEIYRNKYIALREDQVHQLFIMNPSQNESCKRCNYFVGKLCYWHYPSKQILLEWFETYVGGKDEKVRAMKSLLDVRLVQLKKLEW